MGYNSQGLEVWGYPFQILTGYRIGFKPVGTATEIDARSLLRRVDYNSDSITRVYIGPDYIVHEKLLFHSINLVPSSGLRWRGRGR